MPDTKPAEQSAESLVIHHLLKYKIKTSKPLFDEEGTDLLLIDQVSRNSTAILRAQSKYRRYARGKPNNVTIPVCYVSANFVLFLYVIDEHDNDGLYVFFEEDLQQWSINNSGEYYLGVSEKIAQRFPEKLISGSVAKQIRERLKKVEIKKYTSLVIDGIFLEKAIMATRAIYTEIWPKRKLKQPTLAEIIKQFLYYYNRYPQSAADVHCVLFLSKDFHLEQWVTMPNTKVAKTQPPGVRLSIFKSAEIVSFEILDHLDRIINTENILLVADDIIYEPPLNRLKDEGTDVILIKMKTALGGNLYTQHQWGDISYPLGLAMGLKQHEL
jgi:hypothetical protein